MFRSIVLSLVTLVHVSYIAAELYQGSCSNFVPGTDPSSQQATYCSPKDFNWKCSIAIPDTTWHYLEGYISWGRCCLPVYSWNGTFEMCKRNGESDQLTTCGDGFHNWNSPFSSADYVYDYQHAELVCKRQKDLDDADIPQVVWKHLEFITRNAQSVTLLASVHSSTKIVSVSLFREHVQFPVSTSRMSEDVLSVSHDDYVVHFTLDNMKTTDGGPYYVVATNIRASGRSGIARLTVHRALEEQTKPLTSVSTSPKPTETSIGNHALEEQTKPLTSVSTSPKPTEKPISNHGIGTMEYMIIVGILVITAVVVALLTDCVPWKWLKCNKEHKEEQNNDKSDGKEVLLPAPPQSPPQAPPQVPPQSPPQVPPQVHEFQETTM